MKNMKKNNYLCLSLLMVLMTALALVACHDKEEDNSDSTKNTDKSYLTCPDSKHPHLIDLDLPSGTLWSCCNMGAFYPEDLGGFYAWGETEEKEYYGKNDYIYYDASSNSYQDIGKDIAGTQYDVVHVKWGGIWKMPTEEQFYELIHHCSYQRSFINGIRGAIYTSSTNGAYIFLPSAEYRANYWSSTYSDRLSSGAKALYIFPSTFAASSYMDYEERSEGLHIRPVVKK